MQPIIEVKKVNFTYNKGLENEYKALNDINVDIYPEEFIVILGPSGCGKSSLLNILAGLETPDEGVLNVMGRDLMKMDSRSFADFHRREIGMVFQAYNLVASLNVLDNVALPQVFINVRKSKRNKIAKELLERFGIISQIKRLPVELSGGQQQRIGIARSIVNNPSLILADEPVGNLDSVAAENVLTILSDLNMKEKKTIIMVTHNPDNTIYADRIIHMKDGRIVKEEINREKGKPRPKKEVETKDATRSVSDEMAAMLRTYNNLTKEQINILIMPYKSKMFVNYFTSKKNYDETKVFEDITQKLLMGAVSREDFMATLHRPSREGGIGFDIRSSEAIMRRIDRIMRLAYFLQQKAHQAKDESGAHKSISADEKAIKLTDYLLKTCYLEHYKNLDEIQSTRLIHAVKDRINGNLEKQDFYNYLDMPFDDSGVGLNSKTARAMTNEIELILVVGFGASQNEEIRKFKMAKLDNLKNNDDESNLTEIDKTIDQPVDQSVDMGQSLIMESIKERLNKTEDNKDVN